MEIILNGKTWHYDKELNSNKQFGDIHIFENVRLIDIDGEQIDICKSALINEMQISHKGKLFRLKKAPANKGPCLLCEAVICGFCTHRYYWKKV